jgi:hypothetical protein
MQGDALRASLLMAGVAITAGAASGYTVVGLAVAAGLVAGSLNSFFMWTLLERRAPILPTSFLRLAFFTVLALVAARLLGVSTWAVVAGIAAAQLVMFGAAVRRGLRS